jgi:cellulose synthase/poly-beta-1,6-N-acetylglucosamine synthase-like glycosyltransferase
MEDSRLRERFLKYLYKCLPFDLKGDALIPAASKGVCISCLINFYGRLDLLSGILYSLAQQDFPREEFEVILVEDRGGTENGRKSVLEFADRLQIRYVPLDGNYGKMGYSRNFALLHSKGENILFLDDDTVILQGDFLGTLRDVFARNPMIDAIVPHGLASFAVIKGRYDYHDPFFMTSRCMAYRRSALVELGGFVDDFIGQEDVEFVVRFLMANKRALNVPELEYYHPPLLVGNLRKPMAVGQSFFRSRKRYPLMIWLLLLLNCSRHAPLYLFPWGRFREMGRFGLGFILGVVSGACSKKNLKYG